MLLRFLNGPLAGQVFELREGSNVIGRAPECHIVVQGAGISKRHLDVQVSGSQVQIVDLRSSNGSFVNGVQVQKSIIHEGDKVSIHQVLFEVLIHQHSIEAVSSLVSSDSASEAFEQPSKSAVASGSNLLELAKSYIDNVAMPGIYNLLKRFEYRQVMASLLLIFIIFFTITSIVPMVQTTKSSIEGESQRRALSIARNIANVNLNYLKQGTESLLTTRHAQQEEGVEAALLVSSADGQILAPQSIATAYADEVFVHRARKINREYTENLGGGKIAVSVPINTYSAEHDSIQAIAHAVVFYNMNDSILNTNRIISLFTQILLIALLSGGIFYFLLIKINEHPVEEINKELNLALKEKNYEIKLNYKMPHLQKLVLNINAALMRQTIDSPSSLPVIDRLSELTNIVNICRDAACIIDKSNHIIVANEQFEDLVGLRGINLLNSSIENLPDSSFALNLKDLAEQAKLQTQVTASSKLDFSGVEYNIHVQGLHGQSEPEYCLILVQQTMSEAA